MLKLQEELKSARNQLRVVKIDLETERGKTGKREQEAFTAQYQLIGIQEELEKARAQIKTVEEERDALRTSLKEEEVARIAAEGMIALPPSTGDEDDEFASPRKSPRKQRVFDTEDKENVMPSKRMMDLKGLEDELSIEKIRRARLEEQVNFMKMECQFQMCSCRIAEMKRTTYIHDDRMDTKMKEIKNQVPRPVNYKLDNSDDDVVIKQEDLDEEQIETVLESTTAEMVKKEDIEIKTESAQDENMIFSPSSGTFHVTTSDPTSQLVDTVMTNIETAADLPEDGGHKLAHEKPTITPVTPTDESFALVTQIQNVTASESKEAAEEIDEVAVVDADEEIIDCPETPQAIVHTITTTTTIPMQFSPLKTNAMPPTPNTVGHVQSTSMRSFSANAASDSNIIMEDNMGAEPLKLPMTAIDREAALEAIRQRRDRARSMAMAQLTPRKQMVQGTGRRDISAPAIRSVR
jgi:hypothetical protein